MITLMKKIFMTILVIVAAVAVIQCAKFYIRPEGMTVADDAPRVKGHPSLAIKVVEYIDFRCGPCAYGAMWLKDFMKKYPNKIYLEVRYFPIHLSSNSLDVFFAECASRQGKFWEVFDELMTHQIKWIHLVDPEKYFLDIAQNKRLDIDHLTTCWGDQTVYDEIISIKESGRRLGVNATPTYFVNGKMLVGVHKLQNELQALLGIKSVKESENL